MTEQKSLDELLNKVIPIGVYRGVIVEKLIGGYKVLNNIVKSKEEVDAIINNSLNSLSKSITND